MPLMASQGASATMTIARVGDPLLGLELRRIKPLTYVFCKNCVTHL
jgi:hypothetical protein